MRLNDAEVDTIIAALAENEQATREEEGLITDIVAFFDPDAAAPSKNEARLPRHQRPGFRDRLNGANEPPKR